MRYREAPNWTITHWLNTPVDLSLTTLRGRVILLECFQMLCRACVTHALPQAKRAYELLPKNELAVVAIHTVFENHAAQDAAALRSFIEQHDYRFPIGIDKPGNKTAIPQTMARYDLAGTPTTILIDRQGRLRKQTFGRTEDLLLGAQIAALLAEH